MQLRKLLDTEASISLEAKAALEEAQGALATAKAEAAQQLAKLRRELDHRCDLVSWFQTKESSHSSRRPGPIIIAKY